MQKISGHTRQLGIIGYPVEHSFSPKMHNFISERMGNDYTYSAWRVHPDNLEAAVNGIRALGIAGVNVTAPHKTEVIKYVDEVSEQARLLGSVNTVVNRGGKLVGYNTDSDGFYTALKSAGIEVEGKKLLIIGAGGVVKPTLIRLIQAKPESVTVVNRTKSKVYSLAEKIRAEMGFEIKTEVVDRDFDVVINTTSAGMEPQLDALPIEEIAELEDLSFINSDTAVVDMIYNPDETLFLREAKRRGARAVLNGLGMLIYQGLISYELFTGTKLPDDMAEVVKREVFNR
ncbi:MAG: shikimate dehydrogenase [Oscillospiraceae bacterium]|nr:shikimate dehydrogenase [Oscillospiraceae bacterium]